MLPRLPRPEASADCHFSSLASVVQFYLFLLFVLSIHFSLSLSLSVSVSASLFPFSFLNCFCLSVCVHIDILRTPLPAYFLREGAAPGCGAVGSSGDPIITPSAALGATDLLQWQAFVAAMFGCAASAWWMLVISSSMSRAPTRDPGKAESNGEDAATAAAKGGSPERIYGHDVKTNGQQHCLLSGCCRSTGRSNRGTSQVTGCTSPSGLHHLHVKLALSQIRGQDSDALSEVEKPKPKKTACLAQMTDAPGTDTPPLTIACSLCYQLFAVDSLSLLHTSPRLRPAPWMAARAVFANKVTLAHTAGSGQGRQTRPGQAIDFGFAACCPCAKHAYQRTCPPPPPPPRGCEARVHRLRCRLTGWRRFQSF